MVIVISNMLRSGTVLTFGSIRFLNCCSFWQTGSSFPNQNNYQITNFDGSFKGLCHPGCLGTQDAGLIKAKWTLEKKASMASSVLSHRFLTGWNVLLVLLWVRHTTAKCWTTAAGWKFWRKKQQLAEYGFYLAMLVFNTVAVSEYMQLLYQAFSDYILLIQQTFNNYMSRFRIYIENCFAGSSNIFSYLSFKINLNLGGSNVVRQW